jgi:hypothetical protein
MRLSAPAERYSKLDGIMQCVRSWTAQECEFYNVTQHCGAALLLDAAC